jgi:branched-chain amino acid transport system substrate-binding protein
MKGMHRRGRFSRARHLCLAVVACGVMAGFVGACGSDDESNSNASSEGTASAESSSVEPFSIAVIGGETGLYGAVGRDQRAGAELAIKELNDAGGVEGAEVSATYADDAGDPTKGVNAATQAVSDGASAIVGSPDVGAAIAGILARLKVPAVGEIQGGGPIIYPDGIDKPPNEWAFELAQDVTIQAEKMAQLAAARDCKNVAILHDTTSYGTSSADATVASLEEIGAPAPVINDAVPEDWTKSSAPDVGPELTKMQAAQVDCILSFVSGPAAARIALQGKQGGFKPLIIGGNQLSQTPEYPKLGGDAVNGTLSVTFKALSEPNATYDKVAKAYEASGGELVNGQPPSPFVNIGYDSVMAIAEAVRIAKSSDPAAIRDGLEKLSDVEGSLGAYRFTPQEHSGFGPEDLSAIELQDGVWKPQAE